MSIEGPPIDLAVQQIVLDKVKFAVQTRMPGIMLQETNLSMQQVIEFVSDDIVTQFKTYFVGKEQEPVVIETVTRPADWWQAVKERFAPAWAKQRWPVKEERIPVHLVVTRVCPHWPDKLPPGRDGLHINRFEPHLSWLMEKDER